MYRFLLAALLLVGVGLTQPAAAQTDADLPARPVPFTFVTDQGKLLSAADAKKLDNGLRSYAEKTGTQVVVVTVPSLGSRSVADYGRAIGTAWGVGQRDKNNGVVVLIGAQEHKVTIQPGSGLASVITPAVTSRIINQEMTPAFKQGNYFVGLRTGLNTLMATANPSSDPRKNTNAASTTAATASSDMTTTNTSTTSSAMQSQVNDPAGMEQNNVEAAPSGPGMGTLLIGALIIGGVLFFIIRMFKNRSAANNAANGSPNFYPNNGNNGPRPGQPNQPNFYPNQGGNPGPGYGNPGYPNQGYPNQGGGGSGMGGILATGAAAAAGAYLGNRLGGSHDSGSAPQHFDSGSVGNAGAAGAAGTGAAGDYFAGRDGGNAGASNDSFSSNNDYFSDNNTGGGDSSGDYFSSDSSSYDDTSSGDTGGGGFDSTDDNSGSW